MRKGRRQGDVEMTENVEDIAEKYLDLKEQYDNLKMDYDTKTARITELEAAIGEKDERIGRLQTMIVDRIGTTTPPDGSATAASAAPKSFNDIYKAMIATNENGGKL